MDYPSRVQQSLLAKGEPVLVDPTSAMRILVSKGEINTHVHGLSPGGYVYDISVKLLRDSHSLDTLPYWNRINQIHKILSLIYLRNL